MVLLPGHALRDSAPLLLHDHIPPQPQFFSSSQLCFFCFFIVVFLTHIHNQGLDFSSRRIVENTDALKFTHEVYAIAYT